MKKQNAGLIALSIVFILMGGFSTTIISASMFQTGFSCQVLRKPQAM